MNQESSFTLVITGECKRIRIVIGDAYITEAITKATILTSLSRKSFWHLSKTLVTQVGMTNKRLKEQGIVSISELWISYHYPDKQRKSSWTALCVSACRGCVAKYSHLPDWAAHTLRQCQGQELLLLISGGAAAIFFSGPAHQLKEAYANVIPIGYRDSTSL